MAYSSYLLYNTMSSEGWKFGKIDYFLQAVAATCGNNAFSATLKKDRDIEVQVQEEKIFREDFLRKSVTMAEKSSAIIHSDIGRSVYASAKKSCWTTKIGLRKLKNTKFGQYERKIFCYQEKSKMTSFRVLSTIWIFEQHVVELLKWEFF